MRDRNRIRTLLLLLTAVPLLSNCGVKEKVNAAWEKVPAVWDKVPFVHKQHGPTGEKYPPTMKVQLLFKADQALAGCKVFAHLFVWTPAGASGQSIAQAVEHEAMSYGADMILIGRSRQANDDKGIEFVYYGPDQPYSCREKWSGWTFGYEEWVNQGNWASMGYEEWGKAEAQFSSPLVVQAAFLRCQPDSSEKK
ncbi:hypothetical protein VU08_06790 [Desulfobulbus sp. F5]|nr:hypothetical protein [Desulfobulbus sp. F5]